MSFVAAMALAMAVALAVDAAVGWPDAIYRRIGHPVTWLGRLISGLDRRWNDATLGDGARRVRGALAVAVVVAAAVAPAAAVQALLPTGWVGVLVTGVLAWPLVAARSLHAHVVAVARPLSAGRTDAARQAVAMIVGRDPARLDDAGIARAALESLAENTSDGVIAPLMWGAVAGLPGIAGYKAINTLDSMIGHRTARHEAFGMVAARLDDVANWVPARATAGLIALASGRALRAARTAWRDAGRHRSPNAGWPEAAMAGALGVRLSGPRVYEGRATDEPWIGGAHPDPAGDDLSRGLAVYIRAILLAGLGLIGLAVWG